MVNAKNVKLKAKSEKQENLKKEEEIKKVVSSKEQVVNEKKEKKQEVKKEKVESLKLKAKNEKTKEEKAKSLELKAKSEKIVSEDEELKETLTENKTNDELARSVIEESLQERLNPEDLKVLKKEPDSMEELMDLTGYKIQGLKKGQEIKATITDKGKRSVFFDIGAKTEGILIEKEMDYVEDYIRYLRIGDTVMARVVSPENEKGQILMSLARAADKWKWDLFEKTMKLGDVIEVRGLDINKGGMIARFMNIRGFIPVSQFGRKWVGKLDQLYNKVFPVKIIEVDKEKNRLIFSEKAVSESASLEKQKDLLTEVKVGEKYKGQISGVMPFGIFVRVIIPSKDENESFLDGLVHISEISWEKVNDVSKMFKVGEEINVQLINIDEESGKLNLSIKRLKDDPWGEISKKYPVDAKCKGKITRLAAFGAFVEIEKGIEGLIHISKIPSDMNIKVGDKVDVYIESLDKGNHRISLGIVLSAKPVGYK